MSTNGNAAYQAIGFMMIGTGLLSMYAAYKGKSLKSTLLASVPGSGTSKPLPLSTASTVATP